MFDAISNLESVLSGHTILAGGGSIYYPDKEKAEEYFNRLTEEDKKNHLQMKKSAEEKIAKIREKIKEYEL
jgi:hypothetical protein